MKISITPYKTCLVNIAELLLSLKLLGNFFANAVILSMDRKSEQVYQLLYPVVLIHFFITTMKTTKTG